MPALGGGYWYINFTILLILFLPLIIKASKFCSWSIVPITIVLFRYINNGIHSSSGGNYIGYLLAVELGVLFSLKNTWAFLEQKVKARNPVTMVLVLAIIIFAAYARNAYFSDDIWSVMQILSTIPAVATCIFSFMFCRFHPLEKMMAFLGKHSANMYLMHPLVLNYLNKLVYFSKNLIVSYATCVVLTLICSVLFELILNKIQYRSLITKLHQLIDEKQPISLDNC